MVFEPSVGRQLHMEHSHYTHFFIGGKVIEFVDSLPHMDHVLNVNRYDEADTDKILNALFTKKCFKDA